MTRIPFYTVKINTGIKVFLNEGGLKKYPITVNLCDV